MEEETKSRPSLPTLHHSISLQQAHPSHHLATSFAKQVSFDINHKEYGLGPGGQIDIQFHPSEYGILDHYSVVKEIYRVQLSPTIITLTTHNETNMVTHHISS